MKSLGFSRIPLWSFIILIVKNFCSILPKSMLLQYKLFPPIALHSNSGQQTVSFGVLTGFDGPEHCCHVPLVTFQAKMRLCFMDFWLLLFSKYPYLSGSRIYLQSIPAAL